MAQSTINLERPISGTNANGSYIKFPDGTLICWKYLHFTGLPINKAWGSVFEAEQQTHLGSWPVSFTEKPVELISIMQSTGTVSVGYEQIYQVTSTSCGYTFMWSVTSRTSAAFDLCVLGIGRWK